MGHRAPPPPYNPPADKPPLPAGWIPQWDDYYQRWFYVEEATGRSQWEAPGYEHAAAAGYGGDTRGHGSEQYGYGGYAVPYGGHGGYKGEYGHEGEYMEEKKKKKMSKGKILGAAAAGVAVGAIAGAVIAHEIGMFTLFFQVSSDT